MKLHVILALLLAACAPEGVGLDPRQDAGQAQGAPKAGPAGGYSPDAQDEPPGATQAQDGGNCVAAGACVYSTGAAPDYWITACYANGVTVQQTVSGIVLYTMSVAGRVCGVSNIAPAGFPNGDPNQPPSPCNLGACTP